MKFLLSAALLVFAISTCYAEAISFADFQLLRSKKDYVSLSAYKSKILRGTLNGDSNIKGRIIGAIQQHSDGGFTFKVILLTSTGDVLRGRIVRSINYFPFLYAPGLLTTYSVVSDKFIGRISNSKLLHPNRLHFRFLQTSTFYPDLL